MRSTRADDLGRSTDISPHGKGPGGPQRKDLAPRAAVAITAVVIVCFFAVAITYLLRTPHSPWSVLGGVLTLGVILGLQLTHSFPTLVRPLATHRKATLALQTVLTYVPFVFFKDAWLGMPGFLGASSLLILDAYAAWAAFAATVASVGVLQYYVGFGTGELAYNLVATMITGFVVYGLSRMAELVREVQAAREELAELAVTQERLRFARDLHDLLGYGLSTISMKCELTHRLMADQPERAKEELAEVMQATRQALSDVRAVAQGYRSMSLRNEAVAVQSMLTSVGIATSINVSPGKLSDAADTALATVLREGVTNILRHSKAQTCRITTGQETGRVRLTIENDGVPDATAPPEEPAAGEGHAPGPSGSGISNLTVRIAELGGQVSAAPYGADGFRLSVCLPVTAETPAES